MQINKAEYNRLKQVERDAKTQEFIMYIIISFCGGALLVASITQNLELGVIGGGIIMVFMLYLYKRNEQNKNGNKL